MLGLVGAGLSAAAVIAPWLGAVGAVMAALAIVVQYRAGSGPVVVDFSVADWQRRPGSREWEIVIPADVHGRREPITSCWRQFDDHMGKVWLEPEVLLDDTVRLVAEDYKGKDSRFAGQVKIA